MNTKTKLIIFLTLVIFLSIGFAQVFKITIREAEASVESISQSIYIDPKSCYLTVENGTDSKRYDVFQKVRVGKTDNLLIHCFVENKTENVIKIFPNLDFSSGYSPETKTSPSRLEFFVLESGQKVEKSFGILQADAIPFGEYVVTLFLTDEQGQVISDKATVSYSVDKINAGIQNPVSDKTFYQKGETAKVSFEYVGEADEGEADARLNFKDETGNDCAAVWEKRLTKDDLGKINLDVVMEKDCKGLQIKPGIKSKNESEWTQFGSFVSSDDNKTHNKLESLTNKDNMETGTDKKESISKKILFVLMVVIPLLLLFAYYVKRKIDAKKSALILFLALFLGVGLLVGNSADAGMPCQIPNTNVYIKSGESSHIGYLQSGYWWDMTATCIDSSWSVSGVGGWSIATDWHCSVPDGNGSCYSMYAADQNMYFYSQSSSEAMNWNGVSLSYKENGNCGGDGSDWFACCEYVCETKQCPWDQWDCWGTYQSCSMKQVSCTTVTSVSGTLTCPNGFMVYARQPGYWGSNCGDWTYDESRCTPRCLTFSESQIAPPCTSECDPNNKCEGNVYQNCSDTNGDGCYEKTGDPIDCTTLGSNWACTSSGCTCVPNNSDCATNTCTGKTCNDGCNIQNGTKDCSLKINSYKEVAP